MGGCRTKYVLVCPLASVRVTPPMSSAGGAHAGVVLCAWHGLIVVQLFSDRCARMPFVYGFCWLAFERASVCTRAMRLHDHRDCQQQQ